MRLRAKTSLFPGLLMVEAANDYSPSRLAVLKVIYLLAVTAAAFAVPAVETTRPLEWYVVPGLLGAQVLTLLMCGVARSEILRAVWRLKWLLVFLLACYTFLPAEEHAAADRIYPWRPPGSPWTIPLNLAGLAHAGLMCLQLLTVILASAVVRRTGSGTDLVDGLRALGLPQLFVHALDQTLALYSVPRAAGVADNRRKRSDTTEASPPSRGLFAILRRLLRGDLASVLRSLQFAFTSAQAQVASQVEDRLDEQRAHDVAVITGVVLAMVSLKMVKLLPGVPFAPGIKTVLLFPLYIVASRLTWSRWGGTVAGSILGVVGFLHGDGRFGVLEILKHVAPGLVIDLTAPVVRRLPSSALVFCVVGFIAAVAWTSTDLAIVLLLGARAEVYLFPAAKVIPNLIAGTLSGFVTVFFLRGLARTGPLSPQGVRGTGAPAGQETASDEDALVHLQEKVVVSSVSALPRLVADVPDGRTVNGERGAPKTYWTDAGRAMWFDGQADQFDENAGLAPGVGLSIAQAILVLSQCTSADVILDVGTGTGAVGLHFRALPIRYLGLDLSLPMLDVFRRKLGPLPQHMLLLRADSDRPWPIQDRALAVVFASRVVHHLSAPHFVREVWRVCRPGGCLLLGRVTRTADSLPSRLQRHKRALLADHGLRAGGGEQAIQHLLADCCEHGATPLASTSVARWTRTTTARQILAKWEGKPQLMSRAQGYSLNPEERTVVVDALTDWARQEFGDLDRPEGFAEEYTLQGVRLP
jgi:SAM-dependent methyltransferase